MTKAVCPADRPDRNAALVTARACGGRVQIADMSTETDQAFATAAGTVELEHRFRPIRVNRGGAWTPVDTTLAAQSDGRVAAKAASAQVSFSGGGSGPMVTLIQGGASWSVGSPVGVLPAPVLNGSTVRYSVVLPGVDLELRADVDGFAEVLLVKTAQATADPKLRQLPFPTSGKGLTATTDAAGNLTVTDAGGRVAFLGSTPSMWDSAPRTAAAGPWQPRSPDPR